MKFLRIALCVSLVFACNYLMAAPGLGAIQKKIANATGRWENDAPGAQASLREAFADAITWTNAEYVDSVREQGFYTAITCCSPELIDEVAVAADTYLKLFPKGKHVKKVNLYRSMTAWAIKDYAAAQEAINAAIKAGKLTYQEQTYVLASGLSLNKHRSAEHFIEGQKIKRPSGKLTRDLKRFHSGNRLVEGLLNRVAEGKISGMKAVELLDNAVKTAWFAKRAPEAALNVISLKDGQEPYFNSVVTEWCGLERVVKHASSPQLRLLKLEEFVRGFPEAKADELFKAFIDLRYLNIYEFNDADAAKKAMASLKGIPELAEKAEIEEIVSGFTPEKIITEQGRADLQRLLKLAIYLPYDNGNLPVVSQNYLEFMLAISDMVLGESSKIKNFTQNGWKNLSLEMLYDIAVDKKDRAYEIYTNVNASQTPQINQMIEDLLMPLYMPLKPKERLFLAGLAAVEKFPDLGTDLLINSVTGQPRMFKAEHGLAVISDVYNNHMAFAEAQSVWNLLSRLFPDSVWLK